MEVCGKEIDDLLHKYGIKRDIDVSQIYLAKKGLINVPDLSRFPMLRYLWLNKNKIKEVCGQTLSCCLTELYLQDNDIISISGALSHLTSLRVLLLHNNQMKGLEDSVAELSAMQQLHTVSFFLNPFTQDRAYRQYVVHHLPSVQLLDRREVRQEERSSSFQLFSAERHHVLQSLAFGRREAVSPAGGGIHEEGAPTAPGQYGSKRWHIKCPFDEIVDPSVRKSMQRSVMQFSSVDWNSVGTEQQRPQKDWRGTAPNIITVKFR